jgi:ABC-2 type transport system permease protein
MQQAAILGVAPRLRTAGALYGLAATRATAAYEFRMQVRRRSLWLVMGALGAYMIWMLTGARVAGEATAAGRTTSWTWLMQVLMPIAFGVLLADRFPRDRRLRVDELLETAPAPLWARLLGKYLGATAATLLPILAIYIGGLAWLIADGSDASSVVATAFPAFILIDLPGLLFVAAFSVCCPLIMPVPVYQFLYVGYWFWGNLMPPQVMPTIRDTWLTPLGWNAARGFFNVFENTPGAPQSTPADGVISIALLLAFAAAALFAGWLVLRRERNRK